MSKNRRETSEAYVEAAIKLDIPLVKYLLTSDELVYKADINFDEVVFTNLCSKDRTGELTRYLFTSPDLTEHLKFSYIGLRSALVNNNLAVIKILIEIFDKKQNIATSLSGEWGVFEVDNLSVEIIDYLYFDYAKPNVQQALLESLISHNDLEGVKRILEGDDNLVHKEVLKTIAKLGGYEIFTIFDEVTNFSKDKKNIPRIVNMSCNKNVGIELLESIIKNDEYTGYYDLNSRVFKKLINNNKIDLITFLIVHRNAQMTPAIENVCPEEVKQIFAARDLNERLNCDLAAKSKVTSRKI